MKNLHIASIVLVCLGAINWGLWALFDLDLVYAVLGSMPAIQNIVYILIGLAGVYVLVQHRKDCKICSAK